MLKGQIPLTSVRPTQPTTGTTPPPQPTGDLAAGKAVTASSVNGPYAAANAVDTSTGSYWESANNAFPQWIQVDLGSAVPVGRTVLRLPPSWGARTQTLAISGSTDGSAFTTLAGAAGRAFSPASGNTVTVSFPAATTRYLRVTATANSGWPAGQLSALEAYAS
jgi:hypothetical protein